MSQSTLPPVVIRDRSLMTDCIDQINFAIFTIIYLDGLCRRNGVQRYLSPRTSPKVPHGIQCQVRDRVWLATLEEVPGTFAVAGSEMDEPLPPFETPRAIPRPDWLAVGVVQLANPPFLLRF